jgi:hypothetical protein
MTKLNYVKMVTAVGQARKRFHDILLKYSRANEFVLNVAPCFVIPANRSLVWEFYIKNCLQHSDALLCGIKMTIRALAKHTEEKKKKTQRTQNEEIKFRTIRAENTEPVQHEV